MKKKEVISSSDIARIRYLSRTLRLPRGYSREDAYHTMIVHYLESSNKNKILDAYCNTKDALRSRRYRNSYKSKFKHLSIELLLDKLNRVPASSIGNPLSEYLTTEDNYDYLDIPEDSIIQMRIEGYTDNEIALLLGKSRSAITKHISKVIRRTNG